MDEKDPYKAIVNSLKEKSTHKLAVLKQTTLHFEELKTEIQKLADELCKEVECLDGIEVKFKEKGKFQAELRFGEDVIIFFLHNDVFDFEPSHLIWKTSYVANDRLNAYCGMVSIFNFLSTSFEMNRHDDMGYLIGRLFINHDSHFFVDGKKQLGFLYNDFGVSPLDRKAMRSIVMAAIQYCQEFDLRTPPFNSMSEVQVGQMINFTDQLNVKTGKRLGFRFSSEAEAE